ncbi:MAG TPA: Gfo/Idh/MocA family oxidoreductase [Candidatus Hydrogenedentes bacterium]|nr:Gfo/Idh/MocA family oxidoreductase [Candidatus Hydrogenedentota bacterium]HPC16536.1 Gfo/Idh/MocA family oxidoreductase [Candidatus Hydrogenedentota bacterium]HRT18965.1 Gfo/Idh/MocA family oxidoreductase [Candidatus Hydrogenedentota bacterium]HRT64923.1 Gfo/Idh/MocA family oxidoreductase [Candidatus Hydrogenedentota bacterium]
MKRRTFLKQMIAQGAAACFPAILPASALGLNGTVAPSNRIALGFIGLGYEGKLKNLRVFMAQPEVQVVALCDVFEKRLRGAHLAMQSYSLKPSAQEFETCFTTRDWREVVARSDVDAVVISTPDHWHALPAIAAAKAGKDVFCEKPLSLTIREGRVLSDVMQQRQRIFQTASEARASIKFLKACEWVRNGRIGKLHTIRVAIYGGFAQGGSPMNINPKPKPVPEGFDYDMWLGQAPEAFYTPVRYTKYRYILVSCRSSGMVIRYGWLCWGCCY